MAFRILVAGLHHEGNSFSALRTTAANFVVSRGVELTEKARGSGSALGGAHRLFGRRGAIVLPTVSAVAPPGGPIDDRFYLSVRAEIVAAARATRPDAVYLDLHGAMITETLDDPEGDLLEALREALGAQVPIAVSLDLHAHVTRRMLAAADIVVACKTNPHSDYDLAGERAAELLLRTLGRKIHPVTAAVWIPLIIGSMMETQRGPLLDLHQLRQALATRHAEILDISIYNTTTLVDVAGAGQCITVITDSSPGLAGSVASELARKLWSRRDAFMPDLMPLEAALATAVDRPSSRPLVLGDQGDRVLAGTPGDGTLIISELLRSWPQLRALVPLTDPVTVAEAARIGIGGIHHGGIGGRLSQGATSVEGEWRVVGLGDGRFVQHGPFLAREPAELGKTCILRFDNVTVLVTSLPGYTQDVEAFRSQGIDLGQYDVVVSKSGYHFKLSFREIGTCIVVDTPGISNYRPGLLPYRRRRPAFPEDRLEEPSFEPILFSPQPDLRGPTAGEQKPRSLPE